MVLRSVSRGAMGVFVQASRLLGPTHGTGAVIPVERPKEPLRSKVSSRPAPMRSITIPKPPRMTVLSPLPKSAPSNPPPAPRGVGNGQVRPKVFFVPVVITGFSVGRTGQGVGEERIGNRGTARKHLACPGLKPLPQSERVSATGWKPFRSHLGSCGIPRWREQGVAQAVAYG